MQGWFAVGVKETVDGIVTAGGFLVAVVRQASPFKKIPNIIL